MIFFIGDIGSDKINVINVVYVKFGKLGFLIKFFIIIVIIINKNLDIFLINKF